MLLEFKNVRQFPNEPTRRWFSSPDMDFIVWFNTDNEPISFELCYDKKGLEKALNWGQTGFVHTTVDDGENRPGKYKASPVHIADGEPEINRVYSQFLQESSSVPEKLVQFALAALSSHQAYVPQL
ncbi:MAG: hypothetical protein LWW87_12390 [Geobacteraceae bacterium]|nr:hypothetical protein [Geobacteraceae bacterium]